jgi:hypothetical protein
MIKQQAVKDAQIGLLDELSSKSRKRALQSQNLSKEKIISPLMVSRQELGLILKKVVWEYEASPDDLAHIFLDEKKMSGLSKTQLQAKLLKGYSWHQLIRWFGFETAKSFLTDEAIRNVFPPSYRKRFQHVKNILHA